MNNVMIEGLYSDTFSCIFEYKKDIHDIDSFIDIVVYSLSHSFGNNFTIYLTQHEIVASSSIFYWINQVSKGFSILQKELDDYIQSPLKVTTGSKPMPVYWQVVVRHGAIEQKSKIS
jgi:hypothetical protein